MSDFVTRAERAAEAGRLREQGISTNRIAYLMGISRSYAYELIADPKGAGTRARKLRNSGVCEDCGGKTTGNNGRANAPKKCLVCFNKAREAQHGTRSRYSAGCSCDACREANRLAHHERMSRGGEPPSHGYSGYANYGCRCPICTRANTEYCYGYRVRSERRKRAVA